MKVHRAVTLIVLMAISLLVVVAGFGNGIAAWNRGSLVALVVVIVAAAAGGVAFSWQRYFRKPQRPKPVD